MCVLCHYKEEDREHLFNQCAYIKEIHFYIHRVFKFAWPSSRVSVIVMLWTETMYQTWLLRNLRLFGEKGVFVDQVVSRLDDKGKAWLIV